MLTDEGWEVVVATAPGHVRTVRENLFDLVTPEQLAVLDEVFTAMLTSSRVRGRPARGGRPPDC